MSGLFVSLKTRDSETFSSNARIGRAIVTQQWDGDEDVAPQQIPSVKSPCKGDHPKRAHSKFTEFSTV